MDAVSAARASFGMSLSFHLIFAMAGIAMPLLMLISEGLWLRTKDERYLLLTKRWATVTALLFAIGAVSGTAISFELGLLWPGFMRLAGPIIGMPFSMEGFAFFIEAIFLALYLYGWKRLSSRAHFLCGIPVALSGALSGIFILDANAWMNAPRGFTLSGNEVASVDPIAAMFNPFWFSEATHMIIASYLSIAFMLAAVYAWRLLRVPGDGLAQLAMRIALVVAFIAVPLQFLSGDLSARDVGHLQPTKLAAMEALYHTEACAPLVIGGVPDNAHDDVALGIEVPCGLSLLEDFNPGGVIAGLDRVKPSDWPNTVVVHLAWEIMVGTGSALLVVGAWFAFAYWRTKALPRAPLFLWIVVLSGIAAPLAAEAGWFVTEMGRQPWAIYGVVRTADAVTSATSSILPAFAAFAFIYVLLTVVLVWLLMRLGERPHIDESKAAHGYHPA